MWYISNKELSKEHIQVRKSGLSILIYRPLITEHILNRKRAKRQCLLSASASPSTAVADNISKSLQSLHVCTALDVNWDKCYSLLLYQGVLLKANAFSPHCSKILLLSLDFALNHCFRLIY